jgi:hypothetical protein
VWLRLDDGVALSIRVRPDRRRHLPHLPRGRARADGRAAAAPRDWRRGIAAARRGIRQGYESFHHIPDRPRAIRAFERVLEDGGTVILAEPGAAHEHAPVAIDAMQKYGILEKGMELVDVRAYAAETTFAVEQVYQLRLSHAEIGGRVDSAFVVGHSAVEGNLFKLTKGGRPTADSVAVSIPAREGLMRRLQRYLKSTDTALRQPADD